MSNQNINRLFEALAPNVEQKEKMLHTILEQNKNNNKRKRGYRYAQRLRPAVLAGALTVGLAATAFAATYTGLDEKFIKFLNPANDEQAHQLSNGAYAVNKQVKNEKGTLTIKQVIGDSHLTYLLMDFSAPKGTVLDAARYRFLEYDLTTRQSYQSVGFQILDDGNSSDNRISMVMSIMTENAIAGRNIHFQLKDLQAAAPFPGIYTTVIPGVWETEFTLDFKELSASYAVNKSISMFGYHAILQTISVSPISIALKVESRSMTAINKAAGPLKEVGPNRHLDNYPITIKYRDGTSETTSLFNGLHLTENGTQLFTIKTFNKVINDKEIASIVFFNKEIPIKN